MPETIDGIEVPVQPIGRYGEVNLDELAQVVAGVLAQLKPSQRWEAHHDLNHKVRELIRLIDAQALDELRTHH